MHPQIIIGVDPGRTKCGIAAVSEKGVLHREVCSVDDLVVRLRRTLTMHPALCIVIGAGTNGNRLAKSITSQPDFPTVQIVSEEFSTLDAKKRYFTENPLRGWRRLIPESLQTPPEPIAIKDC